MYAAINILGWGLWKGIWLHSFNKHLDPKFLGSIFCPLFSYNPSCKLWMGWDRS